MPIDIEEFESTEDDAEKSTSERIVEYLLEHRDLAFTRAEIADAIDRAPNTTGTNLSRLKDRGLVRHSGNHWAITDDHHRLAREIRFSEALSQLKEEYGTILSDESDAEAWSDAQPDRQHPSEDDEDGDEEQTDLDFIEELGT